MYNIGIQYFYRIYSKVIKILTVFPVVCDISLDHSSLHLLISYSYIVPPSFLPAQVTTNLFSVSMSLFLFCYIHLLYFSDYMYMW